MSSNPPNILVFFTDQQRWDTAGCYGNPMQFTPNLDRMAEEGVKFENAFTCQPVCGPARACIQTGRYATANGVFRNGIRLPDNQPMIAPLIREAGYEPGYIGKLHLSDVVDKPVPREDRAGYTGFWEAADVLEATSHPYEGTIFDADNNPIEFKDQFRTEFITDRAIRFMDMDRDRPFFLFLSYIEPHFQNDMHRFVGPDGSQERFKDPWVPGDLIDRPGDWRGELADYYGCCAALDRGLGRIISFLEEKGALENTLIVFTSDHGCHFRTRNSEYKRSGHESSIRIPMVFRGPGFTGGTEVDTLVSLIDLPPTLLETAGADVPDTFHGCSMVPLGAGDYSHARERVFVQISEAELGRTVRTEKWKYSVYAPDRDPRRDPSSDTYTERYLYDLENDPHECVNLIGRGGRYRQAADALMDALKQEMAAAGEEVPEIDKARYYE